MENRRRSLDEVSLKTFYLKFSTDDTFRKTFIIFVFSSFNYAVVGWNLSQTGTALMDLQIITGTSLDEISLVITAQSLGSAISCLLVGVTFDKFDKFLHIVFGNFGLALLMAITPWCRMYELMLVIHSLKGFTSGISNTVLPALLIHLLKKDCRIYIQSINIAFTVGGILSPIASAPFLAIEKNVNVSSYNLPTNIAELGTFYVNASNGSIGVAGKTLFDESKQQTTEIFKAYIISSAFAFIVGIPFFVMYFIFDKSLIETKRSDNGPKKKLKTNTLPKKLKVAILIVIASASFFFGAIQFSVTGFLATFVVKFYEWEKSLASYTISLYWAMFAFGNVIGIFASNLINLSKFLTAYSFMIVVSYTILLVTSELSVSEGIWIAVFLLGLFESVFFPMFYVWTEEEFFHVTAPITSMILMSEYSGAIINPILIGHLMNNSYKWFYYVIFIESIITLLLFITGSLLSREVKRYRKRLPILEMRISVHAISADGKPKDTKDTTHVNTEYEQTTF